MTKELKIAIATVLMSFFLLISAEISHSGKQVLSVEIDKEEAVDHIQSEMGADVTITFQQELSTKYYFKVLDKDSVYDVYISKFSKHPKVQAIQAQKM